MYANLIGFPIYHIRARDRIRELTACGPGTCSFKAESPGAGVPKAVRVVLPTPATSLEPVVLALAFPLDHFSNVERGDLLLG